MLKDSFYQELISREDLTRKEYIEQVYLDAYDDVFSFVSARVQDLGNITEQDIIDEINLYMSEYLSKHFGENAMYQRYGVVKYHIGRVIIDHLKKLNEKKSESVEIVSYDTITDNQTSVSQDGINMENMISKLIKIIFKKNKGKNRKLTKKQRTVILERFGLLDGDEKSFVEIAKKYNLTRSNISLLYKNGIENIRKELYKTSNEVQQN